MTVTAATLRTFMLLDNVTSVPDAAFTQAVTDAGLFTTGFSDDYLTKTKAAYLMAINIDWQSIAASGSVKFNPPKPEHFDNLFKERLNQLQVADLSTDDLSTGGIGRSDPKDTCNAYNDIYYG